MSTILLPIKPEYAYKILSGEKKYEYRKRIASLDVTRIVIYATYPISKILGEVSVSGYLKDDPQKIWDITKASSGITIEKYNKYFLNKKIAYAYCLKKATTYQKPKQLEEFGISYVPQSFTYLKECPYCGQLMLYDDGTCVNSRSVEHIIPESLGNLEITIPSGHICDNCNNYFATHIENEFLNIESIKTLRSFHRITSKKGKIPELGALFAGEETKIELDAKTGNIFIGLSPETIFRLMKSDFPKMFITRGIDINTLRNNYVVSRFLVKVFTEINLYYALKCHLDRNLLLIGDKKFRELFDYVRKGSKSKKTYSYTVEQTKEPNPLINDDFICSVEITYDDSRKLTGMILNLYELEFNLNIW